jgi:hypothetical protein
MNKTIIIKPHHFLDMIKLYGKGYEIFLPDENYHHDFYKIGNIILENKNAILVLTLSYDDICRPCKFFKDGKCTDKVKSRGNITSKDSYNRVIDIRILNKLELKQGEKLTALELCSLAKNKLGDISEVWKEESIEVVKEREKNLLNGINKYIGNKEKPKNF